jgi:hypothetical protein
MRDTYLSSPSVSKIERKAAGSASAHASCVRVVFMSAVMFARSGNFAQWSPKGLSSSEWMSRRPWNRALEKTMMEYIQKRVKGWSRRKDSCRETVTSWLARKACTQRRVRRQ